MKVLGIVCTTAVFLLIAATVPAFAQEEHPQEGAKPAEHEEQAKPQKQEEAKPEKQEAAKPQKQEEAKPEKQEQPAKPVKQEQAKPQKQEQQAKNQEESNQQKNTQQQAKAQQNEEKNQQHQQPVKAQVQDSQRQYAKNGQKDRAGHVYNDSRFGPSHAARFEANGGRFYDGRREYSSGGYWFYASTYPPWFYQQNVYFVMGADGMWYAVASGDPSLTFEVEIG
jgi:uncharacterized protein involved in copper resistance